MEAGELAKGRGGAIARHRPHLGRKGEDLKLNRKGNIAGGNPKKSKSIKKSKGNPEGKILISSQSKTISPFLHLRGILQLVLFAFLSLFVSAVIYKLFIQ